MPGSHVSRPGRVVQAVGLPPFQSLIDRHAGALHRFLLAMVGPDHADDCLQDTLLAALRAYPALDRSDNLRGWLFTIAHRKALDALRRGRQVIIDQERVESAMGAAQGQERGDDGLWASVRELPRKQRTAVVHRFVEDLPYREIALRMACSEEAARRSVHEGLKKLRMKIDR